MKKCNKCKVLVDTDRKTCPLCFDILQNVDEEPVVNPSYPKPTPMPAHYNVFMRIVTFF
ncbi:MAG: hypothetical protein GX661_00855, partial [Acholeplasmataceae bacterium]|nr:hypothetical protein [Acholeplasmataceae bacterium]